MSKSIIPDLIIQLNSNFFEQNRLFLTTLKVVMSDHALVMYLLEFCDNNDTSNFQSANHCEFIIDHSWHKIQDLLSFSDLLSRQFCHLLDIF